LDQITHRERVLRTIEHQEPDRVPILFGNHSVYSINDMPPYGYRALCEYLGIKNYPTPVVNPVGNTLNIDRRVLDRFHVDFEFISPVAPDVEVLPNNLIRVLHLNGTLFKQVGNLYTLAGDTFCPLHDAKTIEDIENYPYWTDYNNPLYYEGKAKEAKKLHEESDYAIISDDTPVSFGEMYQYLLGFDRKLIDIRRRPEFFHAVMEKIWQGCQTFLENWLTEVGDYIDLQLIYDDQGMQDRTIFSLEDFRKFIKPYWERYIKLVRKYTKAKLVIHSCGSNYTIFPEIIEVGFDAYHTLQPFAWNMEPWRLKKEFGNKICFIGGFDHQKILPRSTPSEVKEFVKGLIYDYAPGGGYIFAPTHDIGGEVPPENIVAGFDAAFEYGRYPIEIKNRPDFYERAFTSSRRGFP